MQLDMYMCLIFKPDYKRIYKLPEKWVFYYRGMKQAFHNGLCTSGVKGFSWAVIVISGFLVKAKRAKHGADMIM